MSPVRSLDRGHESRRSGTENKHQPSRMHDWAFKVVEVVGKWVAGAGEPGWVGS